MYGGGGDGCDFIYGSQGKCLWEGAIWTDLRDIREQTMEIFKRRTFRLGGAASTIALRSKCISLCSRNTEEANVARARKTGANRGKGDVRQ